MKAHIQSINEELRQSTGTASPSVSGGTSTISSGNRTTAADASSSSTIKGDYSTKEEYEKKGAAAGRSTAKKDIDIETFCATLQNEFKAYRNLVGAIFTAKANATVEISKNYMDLIRSHVKDYIGQNDNIADNTVQRPGTNYPNPNNGQEQKK